MECNCRKTPDYEYLRLRANRLLLPSWQRESIMNKGKLMLHAHVEYTIFSWEVLRGANCMWQVSSVS